MPRGATTSIPIHPLLDMPLTDAAGNYPPQPRARSGRKYGNSGGPRPPFTSIVRSSTISDAHCWREVPPSSVSPTSLGEWKAISPPRGTSSTGSFLSWSPSSSQVGRYSAFRVLLARHLRVRRRAQVSASQELGQHFRNHPWGAPSHTTPAKNRSALHCGIDEELA